MGRLNNNDEKPLNGKPLFRHFSHEHPLELTNHPHTNKTACFGCKLDIVSGGEYYSCKVCTYALHPYCYDMPRKVQHPGDQNHDLILNVAPDFECKACRRPGTGFSYNCGVCNNHYHILCLVLPLSTIHQSHHHKLELEFSPPYDGIKAFLCDICGKPGSNHWLYRCDPCEFDVHLGCIITNSTAQSQPQPQPQPQSPPMPPYQAPAMPGNNTNTMGSSGGAQQFNVGANYANQASTYPNNTVQSNGFNSNQAGNYGYNQGIGYGSRPNFGVNQGGTGNGMMGLAMAGVATGIGEGIGQEAVGSILDGSGDDESGIATAWIGGSG